ncbi:MAG: tyrosine-type recombinase/integrase [Synergistaceae bacterium]|nr:tyrosine-type recombinase/integrase [Synergistaceae bacterium]
MKLLATVDVLKRFENYLDVKPSSVRTYLTGIRSFQNFLNGNTNPNRQDVLRFKKTLCETLKPSTVATYLAGVRRFFQWTDTEKIYPNITKGVKAPKLNKGFKKDVFTSTQLKEILRTIDNKRDYAVFSLMATCGLRTVEISRAKVEDLRQLNGQSVLFVQGKGRNEKTEFVKLSKPVEAALCSYLKERKYQSDYLFTGEGNKNQHGHLTTRTISAIAKNAMIHAGFNSNRLTAHSLRHTAITLALLNGATLQEVKEFARHENISTTLLYSHNIDRVKSNIEETISMGIF